MRPPSKVPKQILNPSPSLPIKFSFGISTLSKYNSVVSDDLIPSYFSGFPTLKPLNPFSTIKQEIPL